MLEGGNNADDLTKQSARVCRGGHCKTVFLGLDDTVGGSPQGTFQVCQWLDKRMEGNKAGSVEDAFGWIVNSAKNILPKGMRQQQQQQRPEV